MFANYLDLKRQLDAERDRIAGILESRIPESASVLARSMFWIKQPRGWNLPEFVDKLFSESDGFVLHFKNPRYVGLKTFRELELVIQDLARAWNGIICVTYTKMFEELDQSDVEQEKFLRGFEVTFKANPKKEGHS